MTVGVTYKRKGGEKAGGKKRGGPSDPSKSIFLSAWEICVSSAIKVKKRSKKAEVGRGGGLELRNAC